VTVNIDCFTRCGNQLTGMMRDLYSLDSLFGIQTMAASKTLYVQEKKF
jgi:hypothetical protein